MGLMGITVLSGILIIMVAMLSKSLVVGGGMGLVAYIGLTYLYLQMHEEYHSSVRGERYRPQRRQRHPQRRQQPPTQGCRRPLRTKGFSKVNPREYSKIPEDAMDPFTHNKIHDLISRSLSSIIPLVNLSLAVFEGLP